MLHWKIRRRNQGKINVNSPRQQAKSLEKRSLDRRKRPRFIYITIPKSPILNRVLFNIHTRKLHTSLNDAQKSMKRNEELSKKGNKGAKTVGNQAANRAEFKKRIERRIAGCVTEQSVNE